MAGGYNGEPDPFLTYALKNNISPQAMGTAAQRQMMAQMLQGVQGDENRPNNAVGTVANALAKGLLEMRELKLDGDLVAAGQQGQTDAISRVATAAGMGGSPSTPAAPSTSPGQASAEQPGSTAAPGTSDPSDIRASLQAGFDAANGQGSTVATPGGPQSRSDISPQLGGGPGTAASQATVTPDPVGTGTPSAPPAIGSTVNLPTSDGSVGAPLQGSSSPGTDALVAAMMTAQGYPPANGQGASPPVQSGVMAGAPPQPSPVNWSGAPPGQAGFNPAGAGNGSVSPADRAQQAFQFFAAKGYSPAAAAGIVGNLEAESGMNPTAYNASERAGGVGQWRGSRLDALKAFAASQGTTPDDFGTQLAFLHSELQGPEGRANAALRNATTPDQAAAAATGLFRPAGWTPNGSPSAVNGWNRRLGAAQAAFSAFGGGQSSPSAPSFQVAQAGSGPIPFPAGYPGSPQGNPSAGGASSADVGPSNGSTPAAAPHMQFGPAATPQEAAVIRSYLASVNPDLRARGLAMMEGIAERHSSSVGYDAHWDPSIGQLVYTSKQPGMGPEMVAGAPAGWRAPLPSGMAYTAQGAAAPIPGTGYTDAGTPAPGVVSQRDAMGKLIFSEIPNAAGSAPAGTAWNAQLSRYVPVAGATYQPLPANMRAAYGIAPSDRSSYALSPDGKPVKVADGTYQTVASPSPTSMAQIGPDGQLHMAEIPGSWSPAQVLEARNNTLSSKPVQDAREALANYTALKDLVMQPGGTKAYAFRDAIARTFNPGGIARTNQIELIENAAGLPDQVKQYLMSLKGDGALDPRIAQQGLDAAYAFAKARSDQLSFMNQSNAALAKRHGLDPQDLAIDIPPLGGPYAIPGQRSAYGPAPQPAPSDVLTQARQAIAAGKDRNAVIARVRSMGVNPQGL